MIKTFRDLEIYNEAFELQFEVEKALHNYPISETYLLIDQSKRSCRAVPALIAEGWSKRETLKEFQKFLRDAIGEVNELINHLMVANRKGYTKNTDLIERYEKLGGKINNLKNNWQIYPKNLNQKI